MREHGLLSPHRQPQKPPNAHDGRMTTDRPNEMWGHRWRQGSNRR
ncbi:MAG: hypothetical protein VB137_07855 [Burkholderia sp.]